MSASEEDVRERLRQRLIQADDPREQLRQRLFPEEELDGTTALGAFVSHLVKGIGDAVMATPSATGDVLAMGAAGLEGTARGLTPGGEGFEFRRRFREQQQQFPANAIRSIPRPTTNEAIASVSAAGAALPGGRSPSEAFSEDLSTLQELDERQREEHPVASTLGSFGGTVASLLLGKAPLQSTIRRAEQRIMSPSPVQVGVSRTLMNDLDEAFRSNLVRLPARGLFRAGETGLEAAYLEVLSESENDPMLAAGLASGGQMASSGFFQGLRSFAKGGLGQAAMNFTASAIATGGLWQMIKSATPGGRDRILESLETGFDKTTYALMLGVLGSAMGARGRGREVSEPLQNLIEGFTTVPRTGVLSLITEFADAPEEEQQLFESTLNSVVANPEFQGETDNQRELVRRLRQALGGRERLEGGGVRGVIQRPDESQE